MAPWIVAHQAPLSMEFSRQEYWSGLPLPTSRDLPDPGVEPVSLVSPSLAGRFLTTSATWVRYIFFIYTLLTQAIYTFKIKQIHSIVKILLKHLSHASWIVTWIQRPIVPPLPALGLHSFSSVQSSRSVVSDSLRPRELQHARPPCPSPTPGVHSDSRPSSQ